VAVVRRELGAAGHLLPDDPPPRAWLPLWLQIRVTDLIVDHLLGGDILALEPLVAEDAARNDDKLLAWMVRKLGPRMLMRQAGTAHGHVYDLGRVRSEVEESQAVVVFEGAAFFGNPTWRVLQLFSQRLMLDGMGRARREAVGFDLGPESFGTRLVWG
jgi:hypothetical protein